VTRYKFLDAFGGAEITGEVLGASGYIRWVDGGPGNRDIPNWMLAEVRSEPTEPPPGAYLIGDVLCVKWWPTNSDDDKPWAYPNAASTWAELWERLGGPDVTVTPLVPRDLPEVELPYICGVVQVHSSGRRVEMTLSERTLNTTPERAKEIAAALILAAAGPDTEREA
jgi:hypothetical protein